jgi:TonB family protein
MTSEQVRLSEILISTPQPYDPAQVAEAQHKAEQMRDAIRRGGTFADIARANSQGPTAAHGGDLGCFTHGKLAPTLDELVFRIKVGDVSDVLRTKQGFVVLEVTDRGAHPCVDLELQPKPRGMSPGEAVRAATTVELAARAAIKARAADQKENTPSATATYGPLEVLTDTRGVDFGPYLKRVVDDVRRNWYQVIPYEARSPINKKGKVSIEFAIMKDGRIADVKTVDSSGDVALDRAAYSGITLNNRFSPLPAEFGGQYLALRFHFYYNPAKVSISPAGDVEVLPGSSQRFLATVTGTSNSSVTWSVGGKGCSGDTCGTIADGLYVPPNVLPNPPSVTVKATSSDTNSTPASVTVHLVPVPKP